MKTATIVSHSVILLTVALFWQVFTFSMLWCPYMPHKCSIFCWEII